MVLITEYQENEKYEISLSNIPLSNPQQGNFNIQNLETDQKTLLLDWAVSVLGFSDDGNEIIIKARKNRKSPRGIYIINSDGTNLRHLAYFDAFLEEWYADADEY